jgi:Ulp1 family protease
VYNNVRRWTTKMRLERWGQASATVLECDKLIIPVHLGCHWTCAVINLRDRGICYFDSLGVSCTC